METLTFDLEPVADAPVKDAGADEAVLRSALGKRNRILLRPPTARVLTGHVDGLAHQDVARERQQGFEFVAVEVGFSLRPDFGCHFVAADLSLRFSGGAERPLVKALKPREQVRELSFSERRAKEGELSAKVAPGFGEVLAKLTDANSVQTEGKLKLRDVYGFGIGFVEAGWRYTASLGQDLAGDREGTLVVRRRAGAPLAAELKLGAEIAVAGAMDRWATLAFGLARGHDAIARRFDLAAG